MVLNYRVDRKGTEGGKKMKHFEMGDKKYIALARELLDIAGSLMEVIDGQVENRRYHADELEKIVEQIRPES